MRRIGTIKHVQIQRASLKTGERPHRIYNPAPLSHVETLALAPLGVLGRLNGDWVVDVHHELHPASRNSDGKNDVSFNFTPHYTEIRERFGDFLADGCAGENILIESDTHFGLADLGKRIAIESTNMGRVVYLDNVIVAAPCVEFSHYVNKADLVSSALPADVVKATLQFLGDGRRGFYSSVVEPGLIAAGDAVFTVD